LFFRKYRDDFISRHWLDSNANITKPRVPQYLRTTPHSKDKDKEKKIPPPIFRIERECLRQQYNANQAFKETNSQGNELALTNHNYSDDLILFAQQNVDTILINDLYIHGEYSDFYQ
jgi:hypothetical protein